MDAKILMLRHQLAVALRERPRAHSRLAWPDRAWLALLAGTLPVDRLAAMRLIVTPATSSARPLVMQSSFGGPLPWPMPLCRIAETSALDEFSQRAAGKAQRASAGRGFR